MTWRLSDPQTQALPVNELAMEILRDFSAEGGWNRHSWLNEAAQLDAARDKVSIRALAEGWNWLDSHGFVAVDPDQSDSSRFVTRLGRPALAEGTASSRQPRALGVVHRLVKEAAESQFLLGQYDLAVFAAMKASRSASLNCRVQATA
jgi:hypothetical protein